MIGKLNVQQVTECLLDTAKVTEYHLSSEVYKPDSILNVYNSDYGHLRLDLVFGCGPTPYVNLVAMVKNACKSNGVDIPTWYLEKYHTD